MAHTTERDDGSQATGEDVAIDFRRIERSTEFQELVSRRKRFLTVASAVFFGEFALYLALAAFAPGFMGTQIVDGLPVAWLAAMLQVFLTWAVTWVYLRKADNEFEPLERRAAAVGEPRFLPADDTAADGAAAERSTR